MAPALPGCSSASRLIASCGTPIAPKSADFCSVMLLLGCVMPAGCCASDLAEPHPGGLPALRVQRQDREAWPFGGSARPREVGDRGADDRPLCERVTRALLCRALVFAYLHVHALDDDSLGAKFAHITPQLIPGVVPGLVDQVGVAADLGVPAYPAACLVTGQPIVVPGADRDPEGEADRHHAVPDQLREVLARHIGGERALQLHRA